MQMHPNLIKIQVKFFSETTLPNLTGIVTGWFFFLPNYVCQSCLPSKMAVVAENRNCLIFDKCAKLTEIISFCKHASDIFTL